MSFGACTTTCAGLTDLTNASLPPIVTLTPSSEIGAWLPLKSDGCQVRVVVERLLPEICSHVPGAAPAPGWNAARLATPLSWMTGLVFVTGTAAVSCSLVV